MHDRDDAAKAHDLGRSLSRAIWRAELAVDRAANVWLAPFGLSDSLVGTLTQVSRHPGLSVAELARRSGTRPQSAARLVERLEDLRLVVRSPHPVHGKVIEIHLTERGVEALAAGSATFGAFEEALRRDLTPEESEQLVEQLTRLRVRADELARLGPPTRPGMPGARQRGRPGPDARHPFDGRPERRPPRSRDRS